MRWLRLIAVLVALGCPLVPGLAQSPPPTGLSPDQIARLTDLLKDEAKRSDFLAKLEALNAAATATPPPAEATLPATLVGGFLNRLSDSIGQFSGALTSAVLALGDLPRAAAWVQTQVSDPLLLARWGTLAWKVGLVLLVAWVAEWVTKRLLTRVRNRVDTAKPVTWYGRIGMLTVRGVLELAAVGAFGAGAYVTLSLVEPNFSTRLLALVLINANLLARLLLVAARLTLAPGAANLRLLPTSDETAAYLYVWMRRIVEVGVYGYFGIEAAYMLALGSQSYELLQRLLGLGVVTMLIVFVLQNRLPVSNWLRDRLASGRGGATAQSVGRRSADLWHIVAIGWLVAAYIVWAVEVRGGFTYVLRVTVLTALVLVFLNWATRALKIGINRGFSVGAELSDRLPGLQARADRYLPVLHLVLRIALYALGAMVLAQIWGIDMLAMLASPIGKRMIASLVTIVFVVVGALIAWEIVSSVIERYLTETDAEGRPMPRSARVRTLLPLMRNAFLVVLIVFVTLIVLSELGLNIAPLLAGAGVVGLAIGFGSQTLVRDVITGLFILFEDSIRVGDVVEVSGKSGTVEGITIRAIKLRDLRGNLVTVPFSSVSLVMNMTKDFSFFVFDVPIELGKDIDRTRALIAEVDEVLRADPALAASMMSPTEILGIDRFDGTMVVLRGRIKTQPGKQWAISRAFNLALQARLIQEGIWTAPAPPPPVLDAATMAALAAPRMG